MNTLRSALQVIVGLVVAAVSLVVMTAVGLALIGIALIVGVGAAIAMRLSGPKPAPAMARCRRGPRVWNDGRGKIIDM